MSGARARIDGEWLRVEMGVDESAQSLQLKIWGTLRDPGHFSAGFQQLDDDPPHEYVIISRNAGSGPYYKLQIVDFRPTGILTWAYDSFDQPILRLGRIELGTLPRPPAASLRRAYRLAVSGLEPITP